MIDTHCHLFHEYYDDISSVIERAKENGINKFIVNGYDRNSNYEVMRLIEEYDEVYGAIGFHPSECENFTEEDYNFLMKNIGHPKVVAIGEIGLDYHYEGFNKEKQIEVFKRQIDVANSIRKPIIIHCRDSINDAYNILENVKLTKVFHCFSGNTDIAKKLINNNSYIGVGGVITFKNSKHLKDVVKNIPLEYIVLETDCPYLTPELYRGMINEPMYIKDICKTVSELKGLSIEDTIRVINDTTIEIFDI